MVRLYKEAAEQECLGRVDLSSQLYERALSIRQNYPQPECAPHGAVALQS